MYDSFLWIFLHNKWLNRGAASFIYSSHVKWSFIVISLYNPYTFAKMNKGATVLWLGVICCPTEEKDEDVGLLSSFAGP